MSTDIIVNKIFIILMYILIILAIPIIITLLYKLMSNRMELSKALEKATVLNKPLIIFDSISSGKIIFNNRETAFTGNIIDVLKELDNKSVVIYLDRILEYVDPDDISIIYKELKRTSEFYVKTISKNSPQVFWDYRIKNLYSFKEDKIDILNPEKPNNLQIKIQYIYQKIFKILPENWLRNIIQG